jgi:putative spermidine/putrescine transport system substrate-binding protein
MARKQNGFGRRKVLKGAGALAGAAIGSSVGAPVIWAQNNKNIVLRQFGTGVSNINEIADKA